MRYKGIEGRVWKQFSLYIRLRDSEPFTGIAKCITCGAMKHYTKGDCGHGIPARHAATRFNECNNNFQCKPCNGFEEGNQVEYAQAVIKKFGPGTWNKLLVAKHITTKRNKHDFQIMLDYYTDQVKKLRLTKNL